MKKYLTAKTIFPIFLMLCEGYWFRLTFDIKSTSVDAGAFATNTSFPRFVLAIMLLCTILVLAFELYQAGASETAGSDKQARMDVVKVVILIAAILAYVLLLHQLGFIICTSAIMLIANMLFGQRNKIIIISVSVLFPIFLYVVFRYALKILLPTLLL